MADSSQKDDCYSWIVLGTIVVNNFVCMGFLFATIGLKTREYESLLQVNNNQASIIGSVMVGVFLFSVPINHFLIKRFTCRVMSAIGCSLAISGYLGSAFGSQLWHLVLSYSVITAYGVSINMASTIEIIPQYFERRINMAYTAVGLGSAVSAAVMPIIYRSMREVSSYRDTTLYLLPLILCSVSAPIVFKSRHLEARLPAKQMIINFVHPCKNFISIFYLLNSYFWNAGQNGITVLLFSYISSALDEKSATIAQTVLGISQGVGNVMLTLVLLKFKLNHYVLHILCNIISGFFCLLITLADGLIFYCALIVVIGIIHSICVANMVCVSKHLYPTLDVEYAFAFQEAAGGIGGFVGPYTASLIGTKFGRQAEFYYLGANFLFGVLLLVTMSLFRRKTWWQFDNSETQDNVESSINSIKTGYSNGGFQPITFKEILNSDQPM